jgi:hypothetical protein
LEAHRAAHELWCAWVDAGGYGTFPWPSMGERQAAAAGDADTQQRVAERRELAEAHQRAWSAATDALHEAKVAIIRVGCAATPTQQALF